MTSNAFAWTVIAIAMAAVGTAVLARRRQLQVTLSLALASIASASIVLTLALRERPVPEADVINRPIEVAADGYVSSSKCRACHPHEHATWHDSYHRTMTQKAHGQAVIGDFDDVTLSIDGKDYHLTRDGDDYYVELDDPMVQGPEARRVKRKVAMTTGSHNMQAYWYEFEHTRNIGMLPFTWLVEEQRWISRRSAFVGPESDPVDPKLSVWNMICIKCHTTHGRPRVTYQGAMQTGAYTEVGEFGIACEACHGPGEEHVKANQDPLRRYQMRGSDEPDPTIVNPARLDPERSTMVCGSCHAAHDYRFDEKALKRWMRDGFRYRPGDDIKRYRDLDTEGDDQFWSDGQIRVAGREYNSLAVSPCHTEGGMSCLSCHVLHQPNDDPRPRKEWASDQLHNVAGDQMCLSCHESIGEDVAAHTHHAVGSEASQCMNCHMPHTTYGLMKGTRNHRIDSPSVQATIATGRPNACSQCHLDKPLMWTAQRLNEWYGHDVPTMNADNREVAAGAVWALKGDAAIRALVAWNLGWEPAQRASGKDWMVPLLAELLDDPYEVVRHISQRSLRTHDGFDTFEYQLTNTKEGPKAAKAAALARWLAAGAGGKVPAERRPFVLLDAQGALREDAFRGLLKRRDRRVIRLFE